jgi:hypothetical protein
MDALKIQEPDYEKLNELYKRLEFRQLLSKTSNAKPAPAPKETAKTYSDGSTQLSLFDMPVQTSASDVPVA